MSLFSFLQDILNLVFSQRPNFQNNHKKTTRVVQSRCMLQSFGLIHSNYMRCTIQPLCYNILGTHSLKLHELSNPIGYKPYVVIVYVAYYIYIIIAGFTLLISSYIKRLIEYLTLFLNFSMPPCVYFSIFIIFN